MNPKIPQNYYPDDDPSQKPIVRWRSVAHLLFANWLNYYVYQTTPYDVRLAGKVEAKAQSGYRESAYAETEDDDGYDRDDAFDEDDE